jgi:hypothetical protein
MQGFPGCVVWFLVCLSLSVHLSDWTYTYGNWRQDMMIIDIYIQTKGPISSRTDILQMSVFDLQRPILNLKQPLKSSVICGISHTGKVKLSSQTSNLTHAHRHIITCGGCECYESSLCNVNKVPNTWFADWVYLSKGAMFISDCTLKRTFSSYSSMRPVWVRGPFEEKEYTHCHLSCIS